ncbi:MAG: UPF0149 family protein [Spongiibacteraceae bacterium]
MNAEISLPDFDQLADIYWRLGGMQSPSKLHGYVVGLLTVGEEIDPAQWLEQAAIFIDAIEPPNEEDAKTLLALYGATIKQLKSSEMELRLLLPDDAVEITQRVDSIGQWCQGFMAGFAQGGKVVQEQKGQQQYSKEVSEALGDMVAISQISLSDEDEDAQQREQNIFEVAEYLRIAAMTIYLECHQQQAADAGVVVQSPAAVSLGSTSKLFTNKTKTLH